MNQNKTKNRFRFANLTQRAKMGMRWVAPQARGCPMGLRIHTNLASLAAQHQIRQTEGRLETALRQMASGRRFPSHQANPADEAIARRLEGQEKGWRASLQNIAQVTSFAEIAEGALNEQSNLLIRLKELAIQAANSELDAGARELYDVEFQEILKELDRIALSTQMGSVSLLNRDSTLHEVQVGPGPEEHHQIRINLSANTTLKKLDLKGESVATQSSARSALRAIDAAQALVASARAQFGSFAARLRAAEDHAGVMVENLQAAHSRVADADMAETTSEFYRLRALQQYQIAALAEANQRPLGLVKLIV